MTTRGAVDLITISREYGAGGSELAALLGERLGWAVLDHALVERVADRLRLDARTVRTLDEHPPSLFARIASALLMSRTDVPLAVDTDEYLSPDAVAEASRAAIVEAASTPPLIIVGHGGQSIFQDRPGTLHLRLGAPLQPRVERICRRQPCNPEKATAEVHRMDADRAAYVRRYHQRDWRDPLLYDLEINTGRVTIEEAAEIVVGLIASRAAANAAPTSAQAGAAEPRSGS